MSSDHHDLPREDAPGATYRSEKGTFTLSLEWAGPDIIQMVKTGYQEVEDVAPEQALIAEIRAQRPSVALPYLCIDASNFRGLSRATRRLQVQYIDDIPFAVIAAYGLSLAVRVFAMIFVRTTEQRPVRIFRTRDAALSFIAQHRSELPAVESVGPVSNATASVGAHSVQLEALAGHPEATVGSRSFGGRALATIAPRHWRYRSADGGFETMHTLIGRDTLLTESWGVLTADVVRITRELTESIVNELGADQMYFIHDSRGVSKVERTARTALKAQYEDKRMVALSVIVGKPTHVIMIRWLRILAPATFKRWLLSPSIEGGLERIEEHRQRQLGAGSTLEGGSGPVGRESAVEDDFTQYSREELVTLVREQRELLNDHDRTLDHIVDRLGRVTWDDSSPEGDEAENFPANFDLVFGALDLMSADLTEIIGELNRRMEELRQSKKLLYVSQQIAHLGSWEWHIPTNRVEWSDETYRIYGYEPGTVEVCYELFISHQHPDSRASTVAAIQQTLEQGGTFDNLQRIADAAGNEKVLSAHGYLESDADGAPSRLYGTVHDITDVVRAREAEELAHTEMKHRENALRETLVDLSHDVRTPLSSLKLGLGLLEVSDGAGRLKTSLIAEVEYLDGLFANLVALMRYRGSSIPLKMLPIQVNDVLLRVTDRLEVLARESQIALATSGADQDLTLKGDPLALEQAIGNIAHNAIRFAKANVALLLDERDGWAVFGIRDDGPGIENLEIPLVSERFARSGERANRAGRGLGIGLPIARAIVEEHQGELAIQCTPGEGTLVEVRLPLSS